MSANPYRTEEELKLIKNKLEDSYNYFKPNYDSFQYFMKFVYQSSISDGDEALARETQCPSMEFNITEAPVNELLRTWVDQEPSIKVGSPSENPNDAEQVDAIEGILREILTSSSQKQMLFDAMREVVVGGFSFLKVFTEYEHDRSFDQVIRIEKVIDPTLAYFDKKATKRSKCDADFCGNLFPMSIEEFGEKFGSKALKKEIGKERGDEDYLEATGSTNVGSFNFTLRSGNRSIILVADHYQKKKKKERMYEIEDESGPKVISKSEYDRLYGSFSLVIPPRILRERTTIVTHIYRYLLTDNQILSIEKTSYSMLPLVFLDGNSVRLSQSEASGTGQLTQSYVKNLKYLQEMKNFAGNTISADMQSLQMSQMMMPRAALPSQETFSEAWLKTRKASLLVYNHKDDDNQPVPTPSPMPRQQTPPHVLDSFHNMSEVANVLSSTQHSMIENRGPISGKGIIALDRLSTASALPYFFNFVEDGLAQVALICMDLIPKYYVTARTVPVKDSNGSRAYVKVNQEGGPSLNYDPHGLSVDITPGPSNSLRRQEALETMMGLSKAYPAIGKYIGETQQGIELLLNNLEIKGVESLKKGVEPYLKKLEQQSQMAMQTQQMELAERQKLLKAQDPTLLKGQEIQLAAKKQQEEYALQQQKLQTETILSSAKAAVEKQNADTKEVDALTKRMKVFGELGLDSQKALLEKERLESEESRSAADALMAVERAMSKASEKGDKK